VDRLAEHALEDRRQLLQLLGDLESLGNRGELPGNLRGGHEHEEPEDDPKPERRPATVPQ